MIFFFANRPVFVSGFPDYYYSEIPCFPQGQNQGVFHYKFLSCFVQKSIVVLEFVATGQRHKYIANIGCRD